MITFLETMTMISTCLAMFLGAGVLMYGVLFVWSRAIDLILPLFHFHKEFLAWVYEKYKPKVFTPKLSEERVAELKSRLTRKKEDE